MMLGMLCCITGTEFNLHLVIFNMYDALSETLRFLNLSGCMIFARISMSSTVRILGLLKNEFTSTVKI